MKQLAKRRLGTPEPAFSFFLSSPPLKFKTTTLSLTRLKAYIDINGPPDEIPNLLTSPGLEVEGMEEVESIRGGLAFERGSG